MKKILGLILGFTVLAAACGDDGETTAGGADSAAQSENDSTADEVADEPADETDPGAEPEADEDLPAEPDPVEDEPETPEPVEDEPATPERIVSLSATTTESLFAIGASDLLIAVDGFSTFPANDLPVIDSFTPSVEGIAELEPDLVVISFDPGDLVSGLDALGVTTLVHPTAATIDDAYSQIEELGAVTGQVDEAADLVATMQSEIDELVASAPDGGGITYYHELDDTLFSITSQTFAGEIYALFGLENVADPADDGTAFGFPQLSDEFLVDADPDLVFLADTICCGQNAATVAERPGWDQLSAVQNGNVIELSDDVASRWGPRIVDFAEAIASALTDLA